MEESAEMILICNGVVIYVRSHDSIIFSFNWQQWSDVIKLFPLFVVRWLYATNVIFMSLEILRIRTLKG